MQKILLVLFLGLGASLFSTPDQVIIIRHGITNDDLTLNTQGQERAAALVPYLTQTPALLNAGLPVAIFAARQDLSPENRSNRMIQMSAPISQYLGFPIHLGFSGATFDISIMVNYILSNPDYERKNVLVVCHSEEIPPLIEAFGFAKPQIQVNRFDITYLLTFPFTPGQQATRYLQELLFDDPATLPDY